MNSIRLSVSIATTSILIVFPLAAVANELNQVNLVGSETEIVSEYKTEEQRRSGSSSSSGQDTVIERVIAVQDNGTEFEYDLSRKASPQERSRGWQFPARVFRSNDGRTKLMNAKELDIRLDKWLTDSGFSRGHCGRWIFTWNAFKIDCDLQSVVNRLNNDFLPPIIVDERSQYKTADAQGSGELKRIYSNSNGGIYTVLLQIDPETVRRTRAEADMAVGQMMQKTLTLEDAIRERRNEVISGTLEIKFETTPQGYAWRRTKTSELSVTVQDRPVENSVRTEIVTRQSATAQKP